MCGILLRIGIGVLTIGAATVGAALGQPQHVRESLQTFMQDVDKVTSLVRGVEVMKQRNSAPPNSKEYRTSWEYWASIHGYPGPTSPSGTVQDVQDMILTQSPDAPLYAGFFSGLQNLTPPAQPAGLAESVWATCEHGTRFFFAWHRMYLYFFERVLREASGDPNFALPYWDYTNNVPDAAQPSNSPWVIPAEFTRRRLQTSSGIIPNPLFESRRTAGFGASVQLDPRWTNIDSSLALKDFSDFQGSIDDGVHGFIHCATGNRCLAPFIGLVPFSANDPIFWHHHTNIDRLWECWTEINGEAANPTDEEWMNTEFKFVDENGNPVTMKVSELFDDNGPIDYTYDNVDNCFREEPVGPAMVIAMNEDAAAAEVRSVEAANVTDIEITRLEQEIPLPAASPEATRALDSVARPIVIQPARAVLHLEGVQASQEPGASIAVYLQNQGGERRAFVGVLSFFAFGAHGEGHEETGRDYSFDVSAQLQRLATEGATGEGVRVALVATSGVVGAKNALSAERYRDAGLKIRRMALEIESRQVPLDL